MANHTAFFDDQETALETIQEMGIEAETYCRADGQWFIVEANGRIISNLDLSYI